MTKGNIVSVTMITTDTYIVILHGKTSIHMKIGSHNACTQISADLNSLRLSLIQYIHFNLLYKWFALKRYYVVLE
jgi:hypothetical protein